MPKPTPAPEPNAGSLKPYDYGVYHDFVESYLPSGFQGIIDEDPIMRKLNPLMDANDQMLIIMDLTQVKFLYTSRQSAKMVGVDPAANNALEMFKRVHPEDHERFGMGRSKLISLDKDLIVGYAKSALVSTEFRMQRPDEQYSNHLFQCYMFYSTIPYKAVFYMQVNTNIDWFKKKKDSFHYYVGNDISQFRFPDLELLEKGHHLTTREMEILKLISNGLNSSQIATQLFLSLHTVNTHRSNILKKTGKSHIWDVVYELKEEGLL